MAVRNLIGSRILLLVQITRGTTIKKLPVFLAMVSVAFVMSSCSGQAASERRDSGVKLLEQGRFEEAIAEFDEAIDGYDTLAKYRRIRHEFDESRQHESNLAEVYLQRSIALTELGEHAGAILDLNQAVRRRPQYALAHANRALALTLLGRDTEAEEDVTQAESIGYDVIRLKQDIEELKKRR